MGNAVDADEDLVEVPPVTGLGSAPAQLVGVGLPELSAPAPDRLITQHNTTRKHQLLDLTKAQREPKIQPHAAIKGLLHELVTPDIACPEWVGWKDVTV